MKLPDYDTAYIIEKRAQGVPSKEIARDIGCRPEQVINVWGWHMRLQRRKRKLELDPYQELMAEARRKEPAPPYKNGDLRW